MKFKIMVIVSTLLLITGCSPWSLSPFIYPNYCQMDYWGDNQFNIFGRKNCVGCTGRWIDYNNGRDGYFCTSPRCITYERVQCTDTCNCS